MKTIVVNIILTLILICIFDLTVYWFLPERYLIAFESYRRDPHPSKPTIAGWPKDYYVEDDERGFDIGKEKSGQHWVDGVTYPIWSNSLGCYDVEHTDYANYVYFAGDSFTWGYAPFEAKFGTLIEQATGTRILKCGVEHTGQRHQFSKFAAIVEEISTLPKAIFVFHFENDVANDYAYPHSTVIDGWLMDMVSVNAEHELIYHSRRQLETRKRDTLKRIELQGNQKEHVSSSIQNIKSMAKRFSITANLLNTVKVKLMSSTDSNTPKAQTESESFYTLPYITNGAYSYLDNNFAIPNQEAILKFKRYADSRGIKLIVVLIPRHRSTFDPNWYAEMHTFLNRNGIQFIDLARSFAERNLDPTEIYWRGDPHFNRLGNKIIADILLNKFPHIFGVPESL